MNKADNEIKEEAEKLIDQVFKWVPIGRSWLEDGILLAAIIIWSMLLLYWIGGVWLAAHMLQKIG